MAISRIGRPARFGFVALLLAGLFTSGCVDRNKGQVPPLPTDEAGNVITPVPS